MDTAVLQNHKGRQLITADTLKQRFGGEPPAGLRLRCPCCGHKVNPAAFTSSRQDAHFRHLRNDPVAKFCENYAGGNNNDSDAHRDPVIPLYLTRSKNNPEIFRIEVGLWKLGTQFWDKIVHDSWMVINGRKYDLRQFINPAFRIELDPIQLKTSECVQVEASFSISQELGKVEDAKKAFLFNTDFEEAGGRRIRIGNPMLTGRFYYLVAPADTAHSIGRSFDFHETVGQLHGDASYKVIKIKQGPGSVKLDPEKALHEMGFYLSEYNQTPQLLWPPSITAEESAVPLFAHAPIVLGSPYPTDANEEDISDKITWKTRDWNTETDFTPTRKIGLIGQSSTEGPKCEYDGSRMFIRPTHFHHWMSVTLDSTTIRNLNTSHTAEMNIDVNQTAGEKDLSISEVSPFVLKLLKRAAIHSILKDSIKDTHFGADELLTIVATVPAFPKEFTLFRFPPKGKNTPVRENQVENPMPILPHGHSSKVAWARLRDSETLICSKSKAVILHREGAPND